MRRVSFNSESGVILPIVIILMLALTITGLAFLNAGVMENSLVRREICKNQAFYLAEAGLERTLYHLKEDFKNSRDWTDGDINGTDVHPPDPLYPETFYSLPLPSSTLGDGGEYSIELRYVFTGGQAEKDEIWVKSTGSFKNINKTVQTYVKVEVDSLWNNAIATGGGQEGKAIAGNANIHGSVHILGEDPESGEALKPTDVAIDMTGTAGIRNNYKGIPDELAKKIPPCPKTTFGEEEVESLGATLRVKHGQVKLGGTTTVGKKDDFGNDFKETMDGVYVTDGFTGSGGVDNVYSDNGADNVYDLGDSVTFPRLKDYWDDLSARWLPIDENKISSDIGDFEHGTPGSNYIKWDKASGLLTINGIIYINGGSLDLGKATETIRYKGKGTIVVAEKDASGNIGGEIGVHGDLLAEGTYATGGGFPNNVLGLITYNLRLATGGGDADSIMMGAFYAENKITCAKQNELAGTFISSYFDIIQVPKIYEVPALGNSLQTEMMNLGAPNWIITTSKWQES